MRILDLTRRSVVAVDPARPIASVAALMAEAGVGAVAVVDGLELVGIVTDRDITVRGTARSLPPDARIDSLMSTPVVTVAASDDARSAFPLLRSNAVRRLPITDGGRIVGMVTLDDLLVNLVADLADLVRPVTAEVLFGHHDAPVPATR